MIEDISLVRRAQAGDTGAYEQLIRRHVVMTYRVALRIVGNTEDAQDVSQRALLSAWRGLPAFRGDAAFSTWLHQIVRRHALNCITRKPQFDVVAQDEQLADPGRGPAELCEAEDVAAGLHRAVAGLPAVQRETLNLRHFEGRSYQEISVLIGSTVPAVRSHLYRARRTLAAVLSSDRPA